ncbi:aspartate/glutamate racemase family protein [Conchiformibius kuhniae]|uniref:Aspartate/glutamate racemase family protein n=1 Tax=Conchiformibius kuhniae TaxID=211502 RepID=A0A8T9MTW4_9NEIS|nr:aspartate/glutamate racemase family protein [Conchiformibius kuhniae]UOP04729.1 aspartate/glutamate racemase family protein [Conchiformibius kuhniae]
MRTIGIIGGMSPESTACYYRDINRIVNQTKGGNHSAPLILYSVEFQAIAEQQKNGDWQAAAATLARAARILQQAGAQALVLATNTMHKVAPQIEAAADIPLLHILDAAAAALHRQGISRAAVLGTRFTMQANGFYAEGLRQRGIDALMPAPADQDDIHRIIFQELCVGDIRPQSRERYRDIIARLRQNGAEGVILGCTEIGLLLQPHDCPLPLFDTAALHAQAAAEFVLAQDANLHCFNAHKAPPHALP